MFGRLGIDLHAANRVANVDFWRLRFAGKWDLYCGRFIHFHHNRRPFEVSFHPPAAEIALVRRILFDVSRVFLFGDMHVVGMLGGHGVAWGLMTVAGSLGVAINLGASGIGLVMAASGLDGLDRKRRALR
jgi:hypothetical protein